MQLAKGDKRQVIFLLNRLLTEPVLLGVAVLSVSG